MLLMMLYQPNVIDVVVINFMLTDVDADDDDDATPTPCCE
jgi:hypothetical protein